MVLEALADGGVAEYNIALPHQSAYIAKGVSVGLGGGVYNPTDECDCLGLWQGQGEFFYLPWLSAGLDVRFFGGDLDSQIMVLYQRYRMNGKVHFSASKFDIYLSTVLGLESTDLSEIRREFREGDKWVAPWDKSTEDADDEEDGIDSLDIKATDCEKLFSLDGVSVGLDLGFGINLTELWAFTGSVGYEYNFSKAQLLSLTPGLALNFTKVWNWGQKNLRSFWISFEFLFQRAFNRGVEHWGSAGFLGLQMGL